MKVRPWQKHKLFRTSESFVGNNAGLSGSSGFQGEAGPTGLRGGAGRQGPRGDTGHVGPSGPTGKQVSSPGS